MANPKSAYSVSPKKEKSDTHIIVVWVDNESGVSGDPRMLSTMQAPC